MNSDNVQRETSVVAAEALRDVTIPSQHRLHNLLAPASQQPREPAMALDMPSWLTLDGALANDTAPLPTTDDREGYYGDRHFMYWQSGLGDALDFVRTTEAHAGPLRPGDAVLDLGCASGRVARHLAAQFSGRSEGRVGGRLDVVGADLNARHVEFCNTHLPGVRAVQNTIFPSLPFEDGAFAAASAFSVFTHIDEFETAWLSEMSRVIRPGGVLYATIHSNHTWGRLAPRFPIYQALVENEKLLGEPVTPSSLERPLAEGRRVFRYRGRSVYNCNVFHHESYVRSVWGRFFDVVEIRVRPSVSQDVVVLRKGARG